MLLRNNSRRVLLLAFLITTFFTFGQRGGINNDYFFKDNSNFNPGFIGSAYKLNASIFSKFGRINSNEEFYFGGFDFSLGLNDKHGISVSGLYQRELEYMNANFAFGYAYNFKFKKKNIRGGIGIKAGFKTIQQQTNLFAYGDHPTTSILYNQNRTQAFVSAGMSFWFNEKFYLGFYGDNLVPYLDFNSGVNPATKTYTYSNAPQVGVNFGMSSANRMDSIVHSISFEVNGRISAYFWDDNDVFRVIPAFDLMLGLNIKNVVTPQVGFRYNDSKINIVLGLSARIYKGLNLGYTYNVLLVNEVIYSKGSHEIYLGFFIPNKNRVSIPKVK